MSEEQSTFDTFKTPLSIDETNPVTESISSNEASDEKKVPLQKPKPKTDKLRVSVPLPYKEPEWAGPPPQNYSLEVIKNGTLVSTHHIKSSLLTFGRLEVCDFVFEHPSVSRYHAIIQYCKGDDTHPRGFYLYDLGSTHGTLLNKQLIKPKIYYKMKVGYILKFGGSSRLHIFQGPEEEETEKKPEEKTNVEECSWGMGEDAVEDEEGSINPFALSTPNEELYLEDPKKTLRGWFEREGYEVEYNVEEKGYQTFMCCVKLPIDTPSGEFMPVEATVSGKKKEAVVACALEACRALDRLGLLRQSHHEGRQRKKKRWEENDFYDSDEDTFYDRTGDIEKRREMRKRLSKKNEAENFESIEAKLKVLNEEISVIEGKLEACAAKDALMAKGGDEDSLEMYMSNLAAAANAPTDKFEKRKLKLRLMEATKEHSQLEKMLNIARPTKLPPIAKHPGIIGKRPKSKLQLPVAKPQKPVVPIDTNEEEVEEIESDTENPVAEKVPKISHETNNDKDDFVNTKGKKYGLQLTVGTESNEQNDEPEIVDKQDNMKEANSKVASESLDTLEVVDNKKDKEKMDVEPPVRRKRNRPDRKSKKGVDVYKTDTTDYVTWTPPTGQSGDGMTHLNAKYGY